MKTASSDLCGIAAASSSQVTQRPEIRFNDFISERGRATDRETIVPAAVLPEQFYGSRHQNHHVPGEMALIQSVLEDAIDCFQKQFGAPRFRDYRIAKEAEQWFFTDDYKWPFSFVNICSVLNIDPEYIRRGLNKQKADIPVEIPQRALPRPILVRPRLQAAA